MNSDAIQTGVTIAGTFFTTALTLGKYMKNSMGDMSKRIDTLAEKITDLDKSLAVHATLLNTMERRK